MNLPKRSIDFIDFMTRQSECENETAVLRLQKANQLHCEKTSEATQRWHRLGAQTSSPGPHSPTPASLLTARRWGSAATAVCGITLPPSSTR